MHHCNIAAPEVRSGGSELVWLLGQPHLSEYVRFVENNVIRNGPFRPREAVDEWRAANDHYHALEQREDGIADTARARKLPASMEKAAQAVQDHPWFSAAFGELPTRIQMVELDKLIVSQMHVETSFTDALNAILSGTPAASDLFDFCIPTERPLPPVQVRRIAADRWQFTSGSTDFRTHEPLLLQGSDIVREGAHGPIACMLALGIGFGSNFMSAIRSGRRILLQNGYHRAFALRSAGIRYAPCIIEEVTRKDELKLTASENVCDDPEFYFAARRPPILRDFFDARIAKRLAILPIETSIEVQIMVQRTTPTRIR